MKKRRKRKRGHPLKYTKAELTRKWEEYCARQVANGKPLLQLSFTLFLDVNRHYLDQLPSNFSAIVTRVKASIEADWQERLTDHRQVQGAKFVLSAVYGWRERSDITSGDNPIRTIDAVVLSLNAADRQERGVLPTVPSVPLLTAGTGDGKG